MKDITVYPRGGLGNQLFQYSAAYHLGHKLHKNVYVSDLYYLKKIQSKSNVGYRNFELDSFHHEVKIKKENLDSSSNLKQYFLLLERLVGDKYPKITKTLGSYSNEMTDHIEIFKSLSKPVRINSYCNSPEYFCDCSAQIVKNIKNIVNPSSWFLDLRNEIEIVKPILIHVRLGDYKNLSHIYGSPDLDYYKNAIELIKKVKANREVWLFSDEPTSAEMLFETNFNLDRVIQFPSESRPIESLNALASSDSLVCTNSSFSWWAAFIAYKTNKDNSIIFPRPFFNTKNISEPFNWLPNEWLTLGRRIM